MEGDGLRAEGEFLAFIWTFAFGKGYGRGALNRFLVVLILLETRAVLIVKVYPGVNIFMCWVFNFCLFFIFPLMVLACEMSNPGGESLVSHNVIAHTVTL